jgi:DNA-binding transcriptional MerR regulator
MRRLAEQDETMNKFDRADIDAANNNSASDGFFRIGELSRTFGVTLRALRFYEDKGLIAPRRDGTTRLYTARDVARLKLILLGRKVGFSLREVKQILELYDPEKSSARQLRAVLEKSERQLVKLDRQRADLDEAVEELGRVIETLRGQISELEGAEEDLKQSRMAAD